MMQSEDDKLILGGHEFSSRFILGSGKYSLDLIRASVEQAGAEIITLAPCQSGWPCQYIGLYSRRGHPASQYIRGKECGRGSEDRPALKRSWMR